MIESDWGKLPVSDAHVHFFSNPFFASLAREKQCAPDELGPMLGWRMPPEDPAQLAELWLQELSRRGVDRAALIASVPGDEASVSGAVAVRPDRLRGYMLVDPTLEDAPARVEAALAGGFMHGICLFPSMHRYHLHDPRVTGLLAAAARHERTVVFTHCGVLSVGVRKKLGLPCWFEPRFANPLDLVPLASRYPQLRFVVPHFGAGFFRETLMLCSLCPNVYLDTSSSNTWMRYEELDLRTVFRRAIDVAGIHRLVFGSDSSFFPRGWHSAIFQAQSKALYELGLSVDDARLVFHENFTALFG